MEDYIKLKYGYLVVFARKQVTLAEVNGKTGRKVLLDRIIMWLREKGLAGITFVENWEKRLKKCEREFRNRKSGCPQHFEIWNCVL